MSQNGIEADGEDDYSTTPKWDNFYARMRNILNCTKTQTEAAEAKLNGDYTEMDLRVLKTRMERLQSRFTRYEDQYNHITSEEYVENDGNLCRELQGAMDYIDSLVININVEMEQLQPPPTN